MSWHRPWVGPDRGAPGRQLRAWLVLALILALCVAYILGWRWWVHRNTTITYHQQPPGASATWDGVDFRVLRIEVVETAETGYDGPQAAIEGAAWVEATVEVSTKRSDGLTDVRGRCQLALLGPGNVTWNLTNRLDDRPDRCDSKTEGQQATLVFTYLVPKTALSGLAGLVVESRTADQVVIRP